MKPSLTPLIVSCILLTSPGSTFAAAAPPERTRTISDIPSISCPVLKRSISSKFYKSLLASPIQGHVVVRAELCGSRLLGAKVVQSEPDGTYDLLALQRAKAVSISGHNVVDRINQTGSVLVHLLIYKIADGTLALSYTELDGPGGNQQEYYGCAVLAVQKKDGQWTEIRSEDTGKGLIVRNTGNSNRFVTKDIYFFWAAHH
jgi:hypothetical protein